jgi:hypothetical protein
MSVTIATLQKARFDACAMHPAANRHVSPITTI